MICMDKLCGIVVLYLLLVINKCYLYLFLLFQLNMFC